MRNLKYGDFLNLVNTAAGPFSYRFAGMTLTCHPAIYLAIHWPNGLPKTEVA